MDDTVKTIPWKPIEPLAPTDNLANGSLAALDALRVEWERYLGDLNSNERNAIRQRSLRRLAVETGIIERLYNIEWGLTLTLVADGFARDVVERSGGLVDEHTRATLEAQRESLDMVLDFVGSGRDLSSSFVKELHAAITRTQVTYVARDALGRTVDVPLEHGAWKRQPNHVELADGRLLEYAPPEQVDSEVERLVQSHLEHEARSVHPLVSAAWLHHRFVQIHPFADGNGRVARALVLLVLQKHRYAPLVVDRFHRDDYLKALDLANTGDLRPLIRLFLRLENSALASELESPIQEPIGGVSSQVAHTLAAQLRAARERHRTDVQNQLHVRSLSVRTYLTRWFENKVEELRATFIAEQLADAWVDVDCQLGRDAPRWYWFRQQIISAARRAGHFADFAQDAGWCNLRVGVGGVMLRYVGALHGAGRESGVLAVVTFAELEIVGDDGPGERRVERQIVDTSRDAFRVVHTEPVDAINERAVELTELLDEGLTIALVELFKAAH